MTSTLVRERAHVTEAPPRSGHEPAAPPRRLRHWLWLAAAFPFAFAVPFLLADTLELNRDLFYGLYGLAVAGFVAGWARHTGLTRRDLTRNWRWGLALGAAGAGVVSMIVLRTEDATARPGGVEFVAALLWRGVVYGATDGVLLSVFPILAVFGAFAGTRLRASRRGTLAIGAIALLASFAVTAVYHLGYSDFRSSKLRKPLIGEVMWSAPTLLTLSPLGAPIAHVGLHVTAVAHSYDTNTFLPPHDATVANAANVAVTAPRHDVVVYFLRGEQLVPAARTVTGSGVAAAASARLSAARSPTSGKPG
jgi:hypothetical protein